MSPISTGPPTDALIGSTSSVAAVNPGSSWSASIRCSRPGGRDHPDVTLGPELPLEVVTQRHEIDEVIRVEVTDDDRIEAARLDGRREARERSLTEIEDHRPSSRI